MTFMVSEIYDALIAAGSPEDKARKAAEILTKNEDRLARIETKIDTTKIELESKIDLLKWMLGLVIAGILALVIKAYFPR
jgi:hypothetical protein